MGVDQIVHDSSKKDNIPIVYSERANAPERGEVFTAQAIAELDKKDLIIDRVEKHTGYIKKNLKKKIDVEAGKFYRFEIVAGPYQKKYHNFFYAIPLREIKNSENRNMNQVSAQNYVLIQRLAEFMVGIGWNRKVKKHYKLHKSQRNWDWFYKNFM